MRIPLVVALTIALAAAGVAGCTQAAPPVEPTPAASAAAPPAVAPGTVVATGSFEGATTGRLQVIAVAGRAFEVRLEGFSTARAAPYSLLLSPYPLTDSLTCLDLFAFDLGTPQGAEGTYPLGSMERWQGDPSFLDGAVLGQYIESDHLANDCMATIVARAPLTWTIPDLRPGLVVVDSGSTVGAMGPVALEAGEPATYTVAAHDILGEIAARFGITTHDLLYLNPARLVPNTNTAYSNEILNLRKADR